MLLVASRAFCADEDPASLILEERTPETGSDVIIISREQIERSHQPFVVDLLRTVPGLQVVQAQGPGNLGIGFARGSLSMQLVVYIDDMKFNGDLFQVDLAHLSTTNVERIEITLGPQSALAGSTAMGGVIRIITRRSGPLLSAFGEYGSDTTRRFGARSGMGTERNYYTIAFDRYDSNDANPEYRNDTLSAALQVMVTQWTMLGFHFQDIHGYISYPDVGRGPSPKFRLYSIPWKQQLTRWLSIEGEYFSQSQDTTYHSDQDTFEIHAHLRPAQGHDFVAGYERERIDTFRRAEIKINNDAAFAEYRWTPKSTLQASLAMRIDDDSINGTRFSPRITASYKLNEILRIHGAAGTGYRRPAGIEVLLHRTNRERANGFDFGAEYSNDHFSAGAVLFHQSYQNILFEVQRQLVLRGYSTTGLELSGAYHPLDGLELRANYTFTHDGDFSPVSEHTGSVGVSYKKNRLSCNLDLYLVSKAPIIVEAHARADAAVTFRLIDNFHLYARATNLFDAGYLELSLPAPGRAGYFGAAWQY